MVIEDPLGTYSKAVLKPWAVPPDPAKCQPGEIIADSLRKPLNGIDFIAKHLQKYTSRPLLGFPKSLANKDLGYYAAYPKSGLPIKMIVLDTSFRLGSAFGVIDKNQYEQFLVPELEKARSNKELVMIVSHHPGSEIKTFAEVKSSFNETFSRDKNLKIGRASCRERV